MKMMDCVEIIAEKENILKMVYIRVCRDGFVWMTAPMDIGW